MHASTRTARTALTAGLLAGLITLSTTTASSAPSPAPSSRTERITLSSTGKQLQTGSGGAGLTPDGRYALFSSSDPDVVPGDTNARTDVFVRDLRRGTVERVNVASDGTEANGSSNYAEISADGRYVAFMSSATNLVDWGAEPPQHASDIYVHDRRTGRTERVSVALDGGTAQAFDNLAMSADGRYIAFDASSQRMEGAEKGQTLAYLLDRRTGRVTKISDHIPSDWYVFSINISADGSHLTYVQRHPRGGRHELWLVDLRTGEQKLVNADSEGNPTNGSPLGTSLSADGRLLTYPSADESTVPGAPTNTWELYLYDTRTGKTRWVTHEGKGELSYGLLSADGRRLAYSDEVPSGDTAVENTYVQDLRTGRTQLVTSTLAGERQPTGYSAPVAFNRDGRLLAFYSTSPDLVPGDTNGTGDGFLRRLK